MATCDDSSSASVVDEDRYPALEIIEFSIYRVSCPGLTLGNPGRLEKRQLEIISVFLVNLNLLRHR